MPRESYQQRLARINKLTLKRKARDLSLKELADDSGLSVSRLRDIERGAEVTGGEASAVRDALNTHWSEIWVKQDGMIVVREKKGNRSGSGCYCKL